MKKGWAVLLASGVFAALMAGCGGMQNGEKAIKEAVSGETAAESTADGGEGAAEAENAGKTVENPNSREGDAQDLYIFIAASLSNAMEEIKADYQELHPEINLVYNADSSGTLQTQIEEGAQCDLFFSAAAKQMDELQDDGYLVEETVKNLLENKVVLIRPAGGETAVTGFENITAADNLALAGEDVPVGQYAREIFRNLGICDQVMAMEINEGANVTAVLAAVSEAANEVGVVYATDAQSAAGSVEVIAEAPAGSLETPVRYPAAVVKDNQGGEKAKQAAEEFLDYLSSREAMAVFEAYGFSACEE
ncbi:MAG TPA: molybdate ABC transporter substrate-binding protein [Candidatus Pullilachnospira intestinigallinarum]|nr:molybdate ABC transporter substrate-binding protein [Candidatus Pullilachnospira intestinigallinarum]